MRAKLYIFIPQNEWQKMTKWTLKRVNREKYDAFARKIMFKMADLKPFMVLKR